MDVPSILVNDSVLSTSAQLMEGAQVKAPLAPQEDGQVEEVMQVVSSNLVSAAPPLEHKENGQVGRFWMSILIFFFAPQETFDFQTPKT